MKRQKIWNLLTAIAIAFLVLGYFIEKDNTNIVGRIFIIFGAIIFVISIVGKYSLQGTTQGRYLTGGVPPVRFSM